MQVVYSGGSNTPTPSPRLQRKTGYSRPIMPGYMTHVHPQIMVQRSHEKLTEGDITLRDSIPAMSMCLASFCLVLNILLPGSGTMASGLSVLCCSRVRSGGGTKRHCILLNAGVALMQFMLTFLFLLGWIWSITWGVAFISIAKKYKRGDLDHKSRQQAEDGKGINYKTQDKATYSPNSSPTKRHRTGLAESQQQNNHHNHHPHCHHHHQHHEHHQDHEHHHHPHRHSPHHHSPHQPHHCPHHHHHGNSGPNSNNNSRSPSPRLRPDLIMQDASASSAESSPRMDRNRLSNNNLDTIPSDKRHRSNNKHCRHHQRYEPTEKHLNELPQPIIVLQKAPETSRAEGGGDDVNTAPTGAIMQARSRHMKMLQRKMSDNDLSPFNLTNQRLQAIVIHDLPVVAPPSSSRSIEENVSEGLPKQ